MVEPKDILEGRYTLSRKLGEGGYGVVWEGQQRSTGQRVAVKEIRAELLGDAAALDRARTRFAREMRLAAELSHPNIARLLDSGAGPDGVWYSVFERIEGEPLSGILEREGAIAPREALRWLTQSAEALAHAHARGVVHRDFKPDNIMITHPSPRRSAIVLDFGVAGVLPEAKRRHGFQTVTRDGQQPGTPYYMAPEQIRGELSPASDCYAWGLVALEVLTGRPALNAVSPLAALVEHSSEQPVALPEGLAQQPLGAVIERALAKSVGERYPHAGALLMALEHVDVPSHTPSPVADTAEAIEPASTPQSPSTLTSDSPALELLEVPRTQTVDPTPPRPARTWIAVMALIVSSIALGGLFVFFTMRPPNADTPARQAPPQQSDARSSPSNAQDKAPHPSPVTANAPVDVEGPKPPGAPIPRLDCTPGDHDACMQAARLLWQQGERRRAAMVFGHVCDEGDLEACLWLAAPNEAAGAEVLEDNEILKRIEVRCLERLRLDACYIYGRYVHRHSQDEEAQARVRAHHLQRACHPRLPEACVELALMWRDGIGGTVRLQDALFRLQEFCRSEVRDACGELGVLYLEGLGTEAQPERGLELLEKACHQGYGPACVRAARHLPTTEPDRVRDLWTQGCAHYQTEACQVLKTP